MQPPPEVVHWLFSTGFLLLGLFLVCEVVVGPEVWARRAWRAYMWPVFLFVMGMFMWAVSVFFTNSAVHMIAHGIWAQVMMIAGACLLGLARGRLKSPLWNLSVFVALTVGGGATLIHESQGWFFNRSAFLHQVEGWSALGFSIFPLILAFRPRSRFAALGLAGFFLLLTVLLLAHRDVADIFGRISPDALEPGRR